MRMAWLLVGIVGCYSTGGTGVTTPISAAANSSPRASRCEGMRHMPVARPDTTRLEHMPVARPDPSTLDRMPLLRPPCDSLTTPLRIAPRPVR
jgi:hypothetical protein